MRRRKTLLLALALAMAGAAARAELRLSASREHGPVPSGGMLTLRVEGAEDPGFVVTEEGVEVEGCTFTPLGGGLWNFTAPQAAADRCLAVRAQAGVERSTELRILILAEGKEEAPEAPGRKRAAAAPPEGGKRSRAEADLFGNAPLRSLIESYLGEPLGADGTPTYARSMALPWWDPVQQRRFGPAEGAEPLLGYAEADRSDTYLLPPAFRCAAYGLSFPFPIPRLAPGERYLLTLTQGALVSQLQGPEGAPCLEVTLIHQGNRYLQETLRPRPGSGILDSCQSRGIIDVRGVRKALGDPLEPRVLDGPMTLARCLGPRGMAWFPAPLAKGWVKALAFTDGHAVRTLKWGEPVRTLAGDGQVPGCADGIGAAARFNQPTFLAGIPDSDLRHLWVSDSGNHAVRTVDTVTGEVRTLTALKVINPQGIAVTPLQVVVVADQGHHVIQACFHGVAEVMAGRVGDPGEPLAQGDPACFRELRGLACALTPDFNIARLFVVDGHAIRQVTWMPERRPILTTLAGSVLEAGFQDGPVRPGVPCFHEPEGLDLVGGLLFIADKGNHAIRVLNLAEGTLWTLAGDPQAPELHPGLCRDGLADFPGWGQGYAALVEPRSLLLDLSHRDDPDSIQLHAASGPCLVSISGVLRGLGRGGRPRITWTHGRFQVAGENLPRVVTDPALPHHFTWTAEWLDADGVAKAPAAAGRGRFGEDLPLATVLTASTLRIRCVTVSGCSFGQSFPLVAMEPREPQ